MDEKLKKTLKTSKQGVWAILILSIVVNVLVALAAKSVLSYIQNSWVSIIYMAGLITGLILYAKEKYTTGAEIIQWSALGNIIISFANVIISYIITGVFEVELIPLVIGMIVPIILIIEALKVIRLSEEPGHVKKVAVTAIIIITVIIIVNIITTVQAKQALDDILNGIKGQINNELVNKEGQEDKEDSEKHEKVEVDFESLASEIYKKYEVNDLPVLTAEERVSYEKEWNESLDEMINEYTNVIKQKYPTLSDSEAKANAIQFLEYIKETMFRIVKSGRDLADRIQTAVDAADLANAKNALALKYAEAMADFLETNPGEEYKVNEADLKVIQQEIREDFKGRFTVKINKEKNIYELVEVED